MTYIKTCISLLLLAAWPGLVLAADEMGCLTGDCESGFGVLVQETEQGPTTYRGEFLNGRYHGFGRLELEEQGVVYKGNFANGRKQGRGTFWDADNNVYIGQWRNDRRNGIGTQAFAVEGWEEDKYTEHWLQRNTQNYTGEFQNDVFYGQGTYRWADGTTYTGGWAANKKHGEGYFDFGAGNRSRRVYNLDVQIE